MRTLDYYFGKDDDDGVAGLSPGPKSPRHQPTFNMVIGKRKRAVKKPRKASRPNRSAKLVDYSSSQEEPTDECNEPATSMKGMHRMYSIAQKKKVA